MSNNRKRSLEFASETSSPTAGKKKMKKVLATKARNTTKTSKTRKTTKTSMAPRLGKRKQAR